LADADRGRDARATVDAGSRGEESLSDSGDDSARVGVVIGSMTPGRWPSVVGGGAMS
jgi:hypothetical protein